MNNLKYKLNNGETTFGSWLMTPNHVSAEIMAGNGFDWLVVDCEHTDITLESVSKFCLAVRGQSTPLLARVRECDNLAIRQVLDIGVDGIIVPLINNAKEAALAVSSAKFPPDGIRGFSFGRSNNWGSNFDEYVTEANNRTVVIVMIESVEAVENIYEILEVDGIDGVFIGPYDLSGSYGVVGQTSHPKIMAARKRVIDACTKTKKSAGIHLLYADHDSIQTAIQQGFTFIALDTDVTYISTGSLRTLTTARHMLL